MEQLHTFTPATRPVFDLFSVERGLDPRLSPKDKPRAATERECKAYMKDLASRRGLEPCEHVELHWKSYPGNRSAGSYCIGATFGQIMRGGHYCEKTRAYVRAEYAPGSFSVLMPGARADNSVTMETLDEAGEVVASQTLPAEPKKGGVIWSRDDVRKACGPVAKVAKAGKGRVAPQPRTEPAPVSAEVREPVAPPTVEIQPEAPTSAITMRAAFRSLYSRARKDKLDGADLYAAALELTGESPETFHGRIAQRLYNAVEKARADVLPMRLHLQRQVLNCWGHGNPFRSPPMESPRFPAWRRQAARADALRNRLKEAGRLQFDAGNWVQCLIPVKRDKSPANFATLGEYATAIAGTSRWFVGRWSSRTRAKYEHRFTPAEYAALTLAWERVHSAPQMAQEAQDAPEATPVALEPENAPTGREIGQDDPIAAILARLDAIEAAISAPLPVESSLSIIAASNEAEEMNSTPSGEIQPKRTPAHERAIRRAWAERKARREDVAYWEGAYAEAKAEHWQAVSDGHRHAAKRRRAVLKAREMQRGKWERNLAYRSEREIAEKALENEAQANERRRKARDDWRNAEARLATVTRERDAAHVALQAVKARAERAETTLAGVGERLAAVEGVIQRQRTA